MFGKIFGNRYKPKTACRVHVSKKPSPLKEFLLNSRKKPYLDIRLFRNNNEIAQVILEDTGFSKFTIIGIGTFLIPDEMDRKLYFRNGRKLYLHYDLSSIKPFEPCIDLKPMGFEMPKFNLTNILIYLKISLWQTFALKILKIRTGCCISQLRQ